jgi:hypothetical protein
MSTDLPCTIRQILAQRRLPAGRDAGNPAARAGEHDAERRAGKMPAERPAGSRRSAAKERR